jgi:formate/nitrite transporter FocA (FNT family)
LITGGIVLLAVLYWALYLRRRPHDRWQISIPVD